MRKAGCAVTTPVGWASLTGPGAKPFTRLEDMMSLAENFPSDPTPHNFPTCRFCQTPLQFVFIDLGMSPLCESYLAADQLNEMEPFYPLRVYVCPTCFLVQLEEYVQVADIFSEYAYFSSYADSWLQHASRFADMAVERFNLSQDQKVIEAASNDGYLLQYFVEKNIPVLGIEPAQNVAQAALDKGIPTEIEFLGATTARRLAAQGETADLLIGNNVLAQVPDLNDFVSGLRILLKPEGVLTLEFPHLLRLMSENQFDTIYHEHFSYFSYRTVERILSAHGLEIFDVDELPTHGGSLRVFACHAGSTYHPRQESTMALKEKERLAGLDSLDTYKSFGENVKRTKRNLLEYLIQLKNEGQVIVGYGAPGKGNTLLNYCGIGTDFLDYTVDRNPYKQGKYLPGTHIPIYSPDKIFQTRPNFVLILPWNVKDEIMVQMEAIREWGGQFIVPIPEVRVYQ